MSEESHADRITDLEHRVAELRRANADLARDLMAASPAPRSSSAAAAGRTLAQLTFERDSAIADLQAARRELDLLRPENAELRGEVERLRGGVLGLLRRARARLLRS